MPAGRRTQLVVGALLVAAAVLVDPLRGRPIQLGSIRVLVVLVGSFTIVLALAAGRPKLRRSTVALLALSTIGYACLLALEGVLALVAPPTATKPPLAGFRGRTIEDPVVGFRSAPSWVGIHDDGIVNVEYRHNSRGDRDDETPVAGATRRVLLLGDSYTYGQALPIEDTIQARIESRAGGSVDAYSLGVSGYATVHARRRFEQSDWWRGDDVVYLFFNNDVHTPSHEWDYIRVQDGYAVARRHADGTPYSEEESARQLRAALDADPAGFRAKLDGWLGLTRLRRTVVALVDREVRLTGVPASAIDPAVIDEAVRDALAMRTHAESIGARFHLVVLPAPMEGAAREWSHATGSFVTAARAAGLAPIEDLLHEVEAADYVAHDGHFGPSGADKTAQLVLRVIDRE
jgi:hypothetical protein